MLCPWWCETAANESSVLTGTTVSKESLEGHKKNLIRDLMVNVILQTMLSSHAYLLVTGVIHSKIFGLSVAVRRGSQLVIYIDRALCFIVTPKDSVNRRGNDLLPENKQHVCSFFPI